jgi:ATP-binding cassette, subfamily B (MDR/TAP), member 1
MAEETPSTRPESGRSESSSRNETKPDPEKLSDDLHKLDSKVIKPQDEKKADPYEGMPPEQAEILRRQVETPDVKVGIAMLYRYATRVDLMLLVVGSICAIASGAILPVRAVMTICNSFGSLY